MLIKCSWCHTKKPEAAFAFKSRLLGKRHKVCKECKRAYNVGWYEKNKAVHIKQVKRNNDRYKAVIYREVNKRKSAPCPDCRVAYPPYVMDFDHVRGEKIADITVLIKRRFPLVRILEEIEKCEAVCANCHRERTFRRRNRTHKRYGR